MNNVDQQQISADSNFLISHDLRKNNFDFLRFFLAVAVIYSHCFVIYHGKLIDTEPAMIFTQNQTDIGGIAVDFFFVISGFLILRSFEYSKSFTDYLKKRILRIYPGFIAAFLISILFVGLLGTINQQHEFGQWHNYFSTINKKLFLLKLFTLQSPHSPECFIGNPLPKRVNESLWTIEYEFVCYLIIPLLGLAGVFRKKWIALVSFAVTYIIVVLQELGYLASGYSVNANFLTQIFNPGYLPRFLIYFLAGSCFYLYRSSIPRKNIFVVISLIAVVISSVWVKGINLVFPIAASYLLFYLAFHPKLRFSRFAKKGDFSYGIYLYAWPIQQLLMYFGGNFLSPNKLFFATLPLVYLAAFMSWHWVEKYFLSLKEKPLFSLNSRLNTPGFKDKRTSEKQAGF